MDLLKNVVRILKYNIGLFVTEITNFIDDYKTLNYLKLLFFFLLLFGARPAIQFHREPSGAGPSANESAGTWKYFKLFSTFPFTDFQIKRFFGTLKNFELYYREGLFGTY